ncbi:MAG: glycosyltransferase family 39 protein [Rhodospirillaceae bacterium]|nr:glycosyltransferase family 39 protein [Rhodospirillaceae bacterium]MBT4218676.1 glycosyltransferase family 39 protein [Rhodospirillaceae bacterium]MBT5013250.1 glycosyltransferase family 39 protein [Rhodospirillaceae bacterium]
MAAAIATRPFLPVDETRYLAVAWEMWHGGNYLVPHLNGETYSHKPPLLFWLINAGWAVFGLNDWWPRLVAPLFGLTSLWLTAGLARRLWPDAPAAANAAPLIAFGSIFWALFTTLTMFDMMLTFCALVGMHGIVRARQTNSPNGLWLLSLAIGIGALTKGPAILLTTLPVALLAPFWAPVLAGDIWDRGWKRWYAEISWALLLGIVIGLIWAIPAAINGGDDYRDAIFWGQSAGRMVNSFAHGRPWWWFAATLPVLLMPWTIWPALWRSLGGLFAKADGGMRFCLAWLLPALLVFSVISGKQFHYLLPVFPAIALIIARLLTTASVSPHADAWHRTGLLLPALMFFLPGLALFGLGIADLLVDLPAWAGRLNTLWGLALAIAAAGAFHFGRGLDLQARLVTLASLAAALVVTIHLAARPLLSETFDLQPISMKIGDWQRQDIPLAFIGKYHGQFQYLGRLEKPISIVGLQRPDMQNWIAAHPDGYVIAVRKRWPEGLEPLVQVPFRGRNIAVFDIPQVLAHPDFFDIRQ